MKLKLERKFSVARVIRETDGRHALEIIDSQNSDTYKGQVLVSRYEINAFTQLAEQAKFGTIVVILPEEKKI